MTSRRTLQQIYALFGPRTVLLPIQAGTKKCFREGWPHTTWETTQQARYQAELASGGVAVLFGPENLAGIDLDSEKAMEHFFELNPWAGDTLTTRGAKGCTLHVRMRGDYPKERCQFHGPDKNEDGDWIEKAEWRGALYTVVSGIHPDTGKPYRILVEKEPLVIEFSQIKWPPNWNLPWQQKTAQTDSTGTPPSGDLARRILSYLAGCPPAVSANGGHIQTLKIATQLVIGFALGVDGAMPYLREYNRKCEPPWSEKELLHKAEEADKNKLGREPGAKIYGESSSETEPAENGENASLWPTFDEQAFYGLFGTIVRLIEPHTEADQAAILFQLLAGFGNAVGAGPFFVADGSRHYANLFGCLVGQSSRSRKGTSLTHVMRFLEIADQPWSEHHNKSGISSGEGLIWKVRDPIFEHQRNKKLGTMEEVMTDPGVEDKRLQVSEHEFARVLRVMSREGNTLSEVLRCAWDHRNLETMTKNSPARATNPHISIIGHITREELKRELAECDLFNGFANRFLWILVKRSKRLPHGGTVPPEEMASLAKSLVNALDGAREIQRMRFDAAAYDHWSDIYERLTADHPSLYGQVASRSEAHTIRLAMLYALSDASQEITLAHLQAAEAFWSYCDQSACILFGARLSDPHAEKILEALRVHPGGMTRAEISIEVFQRNLPGPALDMALNLLEKLGLAEKKMVPTSRRPSEVWTLKK
jgi:hypothetical protein